MTFRILRQTRYEKLRKAGFLPFEARPLSRVPKKTPYLRFLMLSRASLKARAKKDGWTQVRYETNIKEQYRKKGWRRLNRAGKTVNDPWQMLRDYEERYKSVHPEYNSPWIKKQKQWREFTSKYDAGMRKFERGEAKYPTGGYYKRK